MIRAVIFDLDGTVLNTLTAITYFVNKTMDFLGREHISEERVKYLVGNGAKLLIERALAETGGYDGETFDRAYRFYNEKYNASPREKTAPYGGIPEMLAFLRERGVKIGILSNKPESAVVPLCEYFFPGSTDLVMGGRSGVPLKPDPTAGKEMLRMLGVSAEECVFVGDTAVDIRTGQALGTALTVGVLWGFRTEAELIGAKADRIVSDPMQIPAIVGSI